jgi:hypothetical protein
MLHRLAESYYLHTLCQDAGSTNTESWDWLSISICGRNAFKASTVVDDTGAPSMSPEEESPTHSTPHDEQHADWTELNPGGIWMWGG